MEKFNEFYDFMSDYTNFFEEVVEREEEKFKALCSRDGKLLKDIMSEHQVTQKAIEDYEKERLKLNDELGFGDKTLKQIAEECPENQKNMLLELYSRLKSAIEISKSYNQKSYEFAKMNVDIIDNIYSDGINENQCYNADGSSSNSFSRANLLNSKI